MSDSDFDATVTAFLLIQTRRAGHRRLGVGDATHYGTTTPTSISA